MQSLLNSLNYIAFLGTTITLDTGIGAEIFESVVTVLQFITIGIGAIISIVGLIGFFEGRGDEDSQKQSKGRNQIVVGVGIVVVALVTIPLLGNIL